MQNDKDGYSITRVEVNDSTVEVHLQRGSTLTIKFSRKSPLAGASDRARQDIRLVDNDHGILWPNIWPDDDRPTGLYNTYSIAWDQLTGRILPGIIAADEAGVVLDGSDRLFLDLWLLYAEVDNGGLEQWYAIVGDEAGSRAAAGLHLLQADETADIVDAALRVIRSLGLGDTGAIRSELNALNKRFDSATDRIDQLGLRYFDRIDR